MVDEDFIVEGTVSPGYESVRLMFEELFEQGSEENSQLCAYVGGERVVDLWGRLDNHNGYNADSTQLVFSCGKNLEALMLAMAVDKGWLDYSRPIAYYWPEFGANGKENITVADLLRHETGLCRFIGFQHLLEIEDLTREGIKKNLAGAKIAGLTSVWPRRGRREYHALTRGTLANEVFRRVEPRQRTLGEFLEEEVVSKLPADVFIGNNQPNCYPFKTIKSSKYCLEGLKKSLGLQSVSLVGLPMVLGYLGMEKFMPKNEQDPFAMGLFRDRIGSGQYQMIELPSANMNASARGMAIIASALANKGAHNGTRLLSEETWAKMHADPTKGEIYWGIDLRLSQGGVGVFGGRSPFYGWQGYGGSTFHWQPELKIGLAYTCTLLFPACALNLKAGRLRSEVIRCTKILRDGKHTSTKIENQKSKRIKFSEIFFQR